MFKSRCLVVFFWFVMAVQPAFADDSTKILGIWKLVSFEGEFQDTGERTDWEGKNRSRLSSHCAIFGVQLGE